MNEDGSPRSEDGASDLRFLTSDFGFFSDPITPPLLR